jgi:hypothetical protein
MKFTCLTKLSFESTNISLARDKLDIILNSINTETFPECELRIDEDRERLFNKKP